MPRPFWAGYWPSDRSVNLALGLTGQDGCWEPQGANHFWPPPHSQSRLSAARQGCPKPNTPKNSARCAASQLAGAAPELAGDNRPIEGGELVEPHDGGNLEPGAGIRLERRHIGSGARNGGDERHHEIGPAVVVARDDQSGTAFVAGQISERKPGEDDAAEGKHLAGGLDEVGISVEIGFFGQPVEGFAGLRKARHGKGLVGELDDDVHSCMSGDAAAGEFGRDFADLGVEHDLLHGRLSWLRS